MASYGRDFGRRGGAGGRGGRGPSGPDGGRQRGRYDRPLREGWGTHPGESYVEDYGSYGTSLEGGYDPALSEGGFAPGGGAPWLGPGWGRGPRRSPDPGPRRWEGVRGGFGGDFGRGYDRGYGFRGRGRGYDRGWRRW